MQLPTSSPDLFLDKESALLLKKEAYKVVLYTDPVASGNCNLKLSKWKELIQETDSLYPTKVKFYFIFCPQNEKELIYLLKREQFNYPVYIDREDKVNRLNKFPKEMEYQCFLLNDKNEVLLIGNPTLNFKVWELYKELIKR